MALGKPIIVSKGTGIDKIVDNENIGYSILYDAKIFIETIRKIAGNNDLQKKISNNGLKLYNEKYSWKKMENILIKEYKLL